MITSIDVSQELSAIDILKALKSSSGADAALKMIGSTSIFVIGGLEIF